MVLICEHCKEEIKRCEYCGKKFKQNDSIWCSESVYDSESHIHFCSLNCFRNYIEEELSVGESIAIKSKKKV